MGTETGETVESDIIEHVRKGKEDNEKAAKGRKERGRKNLIRAEIGK